MRTELNPYGPYRNDPKQAKSMILGLAAISLVCVFLILLAVFSPEACS